MKKPHLIYSSWHFRLLIFEGNLFTTSTFLFKHGSLNCNADEAGVSWSISSIYSHLLWSKQSGFVRFS